MDTNNDNRYKDTIDNYYDNVVIPLFILVIIIILTSTTLVITI